MWRHPSRTGPVKRMRRGEDDNDGDGPHLDSPDATELLAGVLTVEAAGGECILWQMLFISYVFVPAMRRPLTSLPETCPLAIDRRPYSLFSCSFFFSPLKIRGFLSSPVAERSISRL